MEQAEILTPPEAAAYLRVKTSTVLKYAREGKIVSHRLGNLVRFKRGDLDEFFAGHAIVVSRIKKANKRSL